MINRGRRMSSSKNMSGKTCDERISSLSESLARMSQKCCKAELRLHLNALQMTHADDRFIEMLVIITNDIAQCITNPSFRYNVSEIKSSPLPPQYSFEYLKFSSWLICTGFSSEKLFALLSLKGSSYANLCRLLNAYPVASIRRNASASLSRFSHLYKQRRCECIQSAVQMQLFEGIHHPRKIMFMIDARVSI